VRRSRKQKKDGQVVSLFALSGSASVKAARRTLMKLTSGVYVWESSGQEVKFTNWAYGEPSNSFETENSMHMWKESGQWNDAECNLITSPQVTLCEKMISC